VRLIDYAGANIDSVSVADREAAGKSEEARGEKPRRDARGRFRKPTLPEIAWLFQQALTILSRPEPLLESLPWKKLDRSAYSGQVMTKLPEVKFRRTHA
jgi:hypothetical protein